MNSEKETTIRRIADHKNNKFNRECVEVHTADERGTDGANHKYTIEVSARKFTAHDTVEGVPVVEKCVLNFQNGGLKEVGANGITDQALIAIVLDRLRGWNEGQFRCRENSVAITKGEEMLMWMEKRSNDRSRRGVEGERQV